MIREVWDYLTTKSSTTARKEGYLYTAIALSARAKRCEKYWQTHLANCHAEIEKRILQHSGHLAVLGSGLLLETPIELLEKYFNEITLVDIVHTKQALNKAKNKKNIHLVEIDLNGIYSNKIYLNNSQSKFGNFDFVISANLLSQLPLHVCQKMMKQNIAQEIISEKAYELQKKHLQDIRSYAQHGLLFSDYKVSLIPDNKMSLASGDNQSDLINNFNNPKKIEESLSVDPRLNIKWEKTWDWNLAPAPEVEKNKSVVLTEGIFSW